MFALLLVVVFLLFAGTISWCSYKLGQTKTENPRMAATIGFGLSFLPPLALIYLVVLLLKEDAAIV
ncbi:hypothetical protein [Neptunicella sp. SCSIO 80796]|uniref:hypothetical protein n=1 Tax=Neptunicella plasticusilytica TaxID=3117012 RepID=UPI003A4DAEC7